MIKVFCNACEKEIVDPKEPIVFEKHTFTHHNKNVTTTNYLVRVTLIPSIEYIGDPPRKPDGDIHVCYSCAMATVAIQNLKS
jgi:hypothetical protein